MTKPLPVVWKTSFPWDREVNLIPQKRHLTDPMDTLPSQRASTSTLSMVAFLQRRKSRFGFVLSRNNICTVMSWWGYILQMCCQKILALCEYHRVHYDIMGGGESYGTRGTCSPLLVDTLSWNAWLDVNMCVGNVTKPTIQPNNGLNTWLLSHDATVCGSLENGFLLRCPKLICWKLLGDIFLPGDGRRSVHAGGLNTIQYPATNMKSHLSLGSTWTMLSLPRKLNRVQP